MNYVMIMNDSPMNDSSIFSENQEIIYIMGQ